MRVKEKVSFFSISRQFLNSQYFTRFKEFQGYESIFLRIARNLNKRACERI